MEIALINVVFDTYEENYGLERIATFLRDNNKHVTLYEMRFENESNEHSVYMRKFKEMKKALPEDIDVFGFTLFHSNAICVYQMASVIKQEYPHSLVCIGGKLATSSYKEILDDCTDVDFVVRGDGEEPMLAVLRSIEHGTKIENVDCVTTRNNLDQTISVGVFDINRYKYIDRDLIKKYSFPQIYGSKGCTGSCTFCNRDVTKKWVGRSIEDIFQEICYLNNKYGYRFFIFGDSTFDDPGRLGKERISKLCSLLVDYPIKFSFRCYLRAETFTDDDKDLLLLMKEAGINQVYIGIESGNEIDLKLFGKKASVEDNNRILRLLDECKIDILRGFIMFHPFSDEDTIAENYWFLNSHNEEIFHNYTSKLYIIYGTSIYEYFKRKNMLGPDYSYRRPYAYKFRNSYIQKIQEFMNSIVLKSSITTVANDYFNFMHLFYCVRSLFPDEVEGYEKTFTEIQKKVSTIMAEFFFHIYIQKNIRYAYQRFDDFEQQLLELYKKAQNLKLILMVKKPFSELFNPKGG